MNTEKHTAEQKIIQILLKGRPLTARQISDKAGVTYQTALVVLRQLRGLKKHKVRQGSRGPLAKSYSI
jgi:predicted ArsR family transcriptional regulator